MMKWFLFAFLVVVLVEMSCSARIGYRKRDEEACVMKDVANKVGCYADNGNPRPLTEELVNIRDETSAVYEASLRLNWTDWKGSLDGLICECVKKARENGYSYIGVQFYGECWSGPNSENFDEDGEAETCIQQYETPCDESNEEHPCAGEANTNYVYSVN